MGCVKEEVAHSNGHRPHLFTPRKRDDSHAFLIGGVHFSLERPGAWGSRRRCVMLYVMRVAESKKKAKAQAPLNHKHGHKGGGGALRFAWRFELRL